MSDWFIFDFVWYFFRNIFNSKRIKKKTPVYLSINNETQWVPLLCLSSRFMNYASSFILRKLSLEKTQLNLGSWLTYLVIYVLLKEWTRTVFFSYFWLFSCSHSPFCCSYDFFSFFHDYFFNYTLKQCKFYWRKSSAFFSFFCFTNSFLNHIS